VHSPSRTFAVFDGIPQPLTRSKDIDLKKAAKQFAQKFATGASVTKNAQGLDEIVVQGDVSDEVLEMIEGGVGVLKGVPEKNISVIEEKKKKAGD
jgi:density-regulated protein DRP1